jgi:hypothetical protein
MDGVEPYITQQLRYYKFKEEMMSAPYLKFTDKLAKRAN